MSDRTLCDFCQAHQRRDGELSKEDREKLVHRWRPTGHVEHFRRDCHLWPRDGTAFGQRGIDTCSRIGEAGASHVAMLWGVASGFLVSVWATALAQTAVNIDVALILTALTPIIVAAGAVYQMIAARRAIVVADEIKADQEVVKAGQQEIHTLVDGAFTREMEDKLFEMQLFRATLSRQVQDKAAPEDIALLDDLNKRIGALMAKIAARDATVATLPSSATLKPEVK